MSPATIRSLLLIPLLGCVFFSGSAVSGHAARPGSTNPSLIAHEWGTFTSVADRSGQAVQWLPQNGSGDLPRFVKHFRTADFKVGLRGTIRMETPVLYFYSPAETTVSVKVGFSQGVITEWYPQASHIEPNPKSVLDDNALYNLHTDGSIAWNSVTVSPGLTTNLPRDTNGTRYFAARETSSAPLSVRTHEGTQQEKFLFYRGVSIFKVPIAAQSSPDGQIPGVILFERRGDKMGYSLGGPVQTDATIDAPELTATMESLSRDLQDVLTAQGLYPDEARAMVETWRQSWFEEGSRLLYIVPRHFVDKVLPLSINPAPGQIVRVFVGRLELITLATEHAIETALAAKDLPTIMKCGRFLQPIMEQLKAENPAQARDLDDELMKTYSQQLPPSQK
jgi:hypothetical protein